MRFFMTDVGFEPVRMRRRRLALQSTAPLPTDVTSKVGDHVKIDEASPFFLVNLC